MNATKPKRKRPTLPRTLRIMPKGHGLFGPDEPSTRKLAGGNPGRAASKEPARGRVEYGYRYCPHCLENIDELATTCRACTREIGYIRTNRVGYADVSTWRGVSAEQAKPSTSASKPTDALKLGSTLAAKPEDDRQCFKCDGPVDIPGDYCSKCIIQKGEEACARIRASEANLRGRAQEFIDRTKEHSRRYGVSFQQAMGIVAHSHQSLYAAYEAVYLKGVSR